MRNLFIAALIGMFSLASCSKNVMSAQVPDDVVTAFNQRYPSAEEVKWSEDEGLYEVDFREGEIKKEATYRSDGSLLDVAEKM